MRVDEIMQELGLTGPFEQSEYVHRMESQFGNIATKFMEAIDRMLSLENIKDAKWPSIYRRQSKNMAMSHLITAHSNTSIYRAMLEWMDSEYESPPARVCEVGCNNGLFALAVAKLWYESQIVGVDMVREALSLASKFAEKYNVQNCTFQWLNILKDSAGQQLGEFDLVLVPFVAHEIAQDDGSYPPEMGRCLRNLVSKRGRLITINRFPYPQLQQPPLTEALMTAGFSCSGEGTILAEPAGSDIERFVIYVYEGTLN
jgi:2-polyprenyl-3-methyl-5-hydroxy-6-metoxy-1,4-benzoquinol methylase